MWYSGWGSQGKILNMATTDRYLRDICELLIDSRLGYGDAGARAHDPRLKALLAEIGESRIGMIASTANVIEAKGKRMPRNGTLKGTLHRAWMAVRDTLASTDDVNLVAECQRGEAFLIGRYDEALRDGELPEEVTALLGAQREELMSNLVQIRSLDGVLSDA